MKNHKFKNEAEAYKASFEDWLKVHSWHILTGPQQMSIEIFEAIRTIGMLLLWVGLVLTFPISFPIVTYIARRNKRQDILHRYTAEELKESGIEI